MRLIERIERVDLGNGTTLTFDIPWYGEGWWVNSLSGSTNDRVAMYDFSGDKIYTTPHSPFQDTSADWTDVWTIKTCVP